MLGRNFFEKLSSQISLKTVFKIEELYTVSLGKVQASVTVETPYAG